MVVLGILGILIALSVAGAMRIQGLQQIRSSSDVVEKVQLAVDGQYKAIITQAQRDVQTQSTQDAQALINYFNGDADAAQALLIYFRVRQSFPQSFQEAQTPINFTITNALGVSFTAYYPVKSQFLPFASMSTTTFTAEQQSAALLYAAVAQTGAGGSTFASDDATTGAQMDLTVSGVKIHVYKDTWNQPIGFCRFGTNAELQNAPYVNASSLSKNNDPFDPSSKLYTWANSSGNTNKTQAQNMANYIFLNNGDAANATSFNGTNRRPVVYSVGPNLHYESLNNSPVNVAGRASLDDILGYRLTQLGKKGT
jgi:hypothetical protein